STPRFCGFKARGFPSRLRRPVRSLFSVRCIVQRQTSVNESLGTTPQENPTMDTKRRERQNRADDLKEQAHLDSFCARIGKRLIESRDLPDMLWGCTQTMVDDLGAAFARIWILNEQDHVLELQASSGLYTHLDGRHARIRVGSLKIGRIAAERKPTLTNQVIGDPCVPEQEWAK